MAGTEIDIVQRETSVSLVHPSVDAPGGSTPRAILFSKSSTLTGAACRTSGCSVGILKAFGLVKRALSGLAFSGSDQARKGRLVDALAVRGDEGRDTLR